MIVSSRLFARYPLSHVLLTSGPVGRFPFSDLYSVPYAMECSAQTEARLHTFTSGISMFIPDMHLYLYSVSCTSCIHVQ